jgi:hypothetical protein
MHDNNHCDTAVELIQEALHLYVKSFELKQHHPQSKKEKQEQHLAEMEAQLEEDVEKEEKAMNFILRSAESHINRFY